MGDTEIEIEKALVSLLLYKPDSKVLFMSIKIIEIKNIFMKYFSFLLILKQLASQLPCLSTGWVD